MGMKRRVAKAPLLPLHVCAHCGAPFRGVVEEHRLCARCHAFGELHRWSREARRNGADLTPTSAGRTQH